MKIILFKLGMLVITIVKYTGFIAISLVAIATAIAGLTAVAHNLTRLVLFVWANS